MNLVADEKPKDFLADLICQDRVVPHPENLTLVFRRSHVLSNPSSEWLNSIGHINKFIILPHP